MGSSHNQKALLGGGFSTKLYLQERWKFHRQITRSELLMFLSPLLSPQNLRIISYPVTKLQRLLSTSQLSFSHFVIFSFLETYSFLYMLSWVLFCFVLIVFSIVMQLDTIEFYSVKQEWWCKRTIEEEEREGFHSKRITSHSIYVWVESIQGESGEGEGVTTREVNGLSVW